MSSIAFQDEVRRSVVVEPRYRVVLCRGYDALAQQAIRALITRLRGELHGPAVTVAKRLYLHLGRRRLDDVVTGLEAAGYAIDAVVLSHPEPRAVFDG